MSKATIAVLCFASGVALTLAVLKLRAIGGASSAAHAQGTQVGLKDEYLGSQDNQYINGMK
jgi:hypothetical protein